MANQQILQNVRVFDGHQICEPSVVYISNGYIVASEKMEADNEHAHVIDCKNNILLPGYIDAHIHLKSEDTLKQFCSYGVTTALDMGTWPLKLVDSLRSLPGLTDIRSAGLVATAPGSKHSHIPNLPSKMLISTEQQAYDFVADIIQENCDYIKIIADIPGPSQQVINALAKAAKARNRLSIAHASANATFAMAQTANVDIITHIPLEAILPSAIIDEMLATGTTTVPTLTMMEGIANKANLPNMKYTNAKASVTALHKAGVTILAGTDANAQPGVPFSPVFGDSLHHEMELLVDAGMSTVEVLRAATSEVAKVFGLNDRGTIQVGKRADLVLLHGDPVLDIKETRSIERVWCKGVEVK